MYSTANWSHLKMLHFLKYKTNILHMVKSLASIDMKAMDWESRAKLVVKINLQD